MFWFHVSYLLSDRGFIRYRQVSCGRRPISGSSGTRRSLPFPHLISLRGTSFPWVFPCDLRASTPSLDISGGHHHSTFSTCCPQSSVRIIQHCILRLIVVVTEFISCDFSKPVDSNSTIVTVSRNKQFMTTIFSNFSHSPFMIIFTSMNDDIRLSLLQTTERTETSGTISRAM